MAQTSIKEKLAFGFPGEPGNGQPWVADAVIAAAEVTFGTAAGRKSDGTVGPYGSTYSTYIGLFVGPHEHVRQVLPTDSRSIAVPAGETVAVACKGSWFINLPAGAQTGATTDGTNITWTTNAKVGDKVYVTSAGAITFDSTSNTEIGEVLDIEVSDNAVGTISGAGTTESPYVVTVTTEAKGGVLIRLK